MKDLGELQQSCRKRVEEELAAGDQSRDSKWTESIAVGSKVFIEATIERLGIRAKGRKIVGSERSYELHEPEVPYGANLAPENGPLRLQNTYFWDDIV
jgi:putative transposase